MFQIKFVVCNKLCIIYQFGLYLEPFWVKTIHFKFQFRTE